MSFLVARSVSRSVGGAVLLSDVSLSVESGEVVAVIGPNGGGKSTLLSVLAGSVTADSGTIAVGGETISELTMEELARRRAYLPADIDMTVRFTAREVAQMGRRPWTTATEDESRTTAAIDTLDLNELEDHVFSTLSTGEARRVHVARILVQDTPLLLLDEPTAGLDIAHVELVLRVLRNQAEKGKAVVVVLHDLNAAGRVADRVVLLGEGSVVAEGEPLDVMDADVLSRVYGHPIAVGDHPLTRGPLIAPIEDS